MEVVINYDPTNGILLKGKFQASLVRSSPARREEHVGPPKEPHLHATGNRGCHLSVLSRPKDDVVDSKHPFE